VLGKVGGHGREGPLGLVEVAPLDQHVDRYARRERTIVVYSVPSHTCAL
jgi:hypothetical protein